MPTSRCSELIDRNRRVRTHRSMPSSFRIIHMLDTALRISCILFAWSVSIIYGQGPGTDERFPKLRYETWSGAINVPDPVSVSVANDGQVFVTQTQRRKIQDLDIRAHREWVPRDVALTSVDEKRAFYHEVLSIGGDQESAARHVEDLNEDGQFDWRDLTVISERIHRLADRDGDGTADETTVFADGFQTEVTGIACRSVTS